MTTAKHSPAVLGVERLAGIAERVEKATPGPWSADDSIAKAYADDDRTRGAILVHAVDKSRGPIAHVYFGTEPDAHLIAHSRADIPALLASEAALRKLARDLLAALPECEDCTLPATQGREGDWLHYCDEHAPDHLTQTCDRPWAPTVRAAITAGLHNDDHATNRPLAAGRREG